MLDYHCSVCFVVTCSTCIRLSSCSHLREHLRTHGVQRRMISVDNFFVFFRFIIFCFVVAICDLVHAVKAMYDLP